VLSRTIDSIRVIEASLLLLNHPDQDVRRQIWALLSELYGQDSVLYLRRLRDHGQRDVQIAAKNALSGLTELGIEITTQPTRQLHIVCLGTFRVYVGSRELQPQDWAGSGLSRGGGLKAQSMLAYLLHCGAGGATEDELIDAIWGNAAPSPASFARTQSHLFDVLDGKDRPHGQCRFIVKNKRHLTLRPELCSNDAERFLQHWRRAEQTEDELSLSAAVPFYQEVVHHYSGTYMHTVPKGWDWHCDRAQHIQTAYLAALERLATSAYISGNYAQCRSLCQQGLLIDRSDQLLTEKLLVVLADLELPVEATRAFIYYLEATGLQANSPEYHEDSVVQTYWHCWPDSARSVAPKNHRN
jgi:two-component SAPR family response regulator